MPDEPAHSDYRIERQFSENSQLAQSSGGQRVLLKALDEDCLLRGNLHPMVKDRLGRVRELAHVGVANLLGVERLDDRAYLVWSYVEGCTLEEYVQKHEDDLWLLRQAARELVLCVEALHALGIVHGAIHERNVIVTPGGKVVLTHVSPLLYNDPGVDVDCLVGLLEFMGCGLKLYGPGLPSFQKMISQLSSTPVAGTCIEAPAADRDGSRRRSLIGALVVALIGLAVAWGFWKWM